MASRVFSRALSLFLALGVMMLPAGGRLAAADSWIVECVDCPRYFDHLTDRSLRLDAAGHPHVAYGEDHLYHARHDGTQWHIETVDADPGVGGYASLALDSSGRAHIAYYDATRDALRYAYQDAGTGAWQVQTVEEGSAGMYASLALGTSGQPHIAYQGPGGAKYAYRDQAGWQTEEIDSDGSAVFKHLSLALDRYDRPRVAYFLDDDVDSNWDVRYAYRDQTGWHVQVVDELPGSGGGDTSLALDSSDRPHVTYIGEGGDDYDVEYAAYTGSAWTHQTVDENVGGLGGHTSLALDTAGRPRVSYYDDNWSRLGYADRDSGSWQTQIVDPDVPDGYTSLAVDPGGAAHIVYFHTNGYLLEHAVQAGVEWQIETVDTGRVVGTFSSLQVDGQQVPRVSYLDSAQDEIRYAVKAGGWQIETVDDVGDYGCDTSLAVDAGGGAHLGYYYRVPLSSAYQLVYAYRDVDGWHAQDLNTGSFYFYGNLSLALAPDGQPHLGYSDNMPAHAWRAASGWQTEYASGASTRDVWLALTADGEPRVVYYLLAEHGLIYAYKDGTGWHTETVEADVGYSGGRASLALDAADNPHISYYTALTGQESLKYAFRDAEGWHLETVEAGIGGWSTAIALGADGVPRIAYQVIIDSSHGELRYATRSAGGWLPSSVPGGGHVLGNVSLALDGDDVPHISFYDAATRDLMHAFYAVMDHRVYLPVAYRQW